MHTLCDIIYLNIYLKSYGYYSLKSCSSGTSQTQESCVL